MHGFGHNEAILAGDSAANAICRDSEFGMATRQQEQFSQRMSRISRQHSKMASGYVTKVTDDGLVVAKPKRRGKSSLLKGLAIMIAVIFIFKAILYANLGAVDYNERVEGLKGGNLVEQGGAVLMSADPLTVWASQYLVSLVR